MNGPFGASPPRQARTIMADPPAGSYRNLAVDNTSGSESTKIDISATSIVLEDANFNTYIARNVAVTVDSAVSGAGGVESGTTVTGSNWYARHVIYSPGDGRVRGLLSASATAPVLPAGFTFSAFTGWHRTTGGNFHRIRQRGKVAQYVVSSAVTTVLPVMDSGIKGSGLASATPTWQSIAVGSFVPTTASEIFGTVSAQGANIMVAPSNLFAGVNQTNTPPLSVNAASSLQIGFSLLLEGSNIYWVSDGASNKIVCRGWTEA